MTDNMRKTAHPAFRFVVSISGEKEKTAAVFTECTLPVIEWDMQEVKEGGLNSYVHLLPGRRKRATVTLKNGVGLSQTLIDWYLNSMKENFSRKTITIKLLSLSAASADAPRESVMEWVLADCMPIKWTGPQLKTADNTIAIQTLELACCDITCQVPKLKDSGESVTFTPHKPKKARATNPSNPNLIPAQQPKAPRATNPSNPNLISPHVIPPASQRVQKKDG